MFPFTSMKGYNRCQGWIKHLLFEKYSLRNISDVIKSLNSRKGLYESTYQDQFMIDDLEIEPYSDFEVAQLLEIKSPVNFTVKSDEGDEWIIKLDIDKHTVKDLKRMILNKKNKPFILNPPVPNSKSL